MRVKKKKLKRKKLKRKHLKRKHRKKRSKKKRSKKKEPVKKKEVKKKDTLEKILEHHLKKFNYPKFQNLDRKTEFYTIFYDLGLTSRPFNYSRSANERDDIDNAIEKYKKSKKWNNPHKISLKKEDKQLQDFFDSLDLSETKKEPKKKEEEEEVKKNFPFTQSNEKLKKYQESQFGISSNDFSLENETFKEIKLPKINYKDKAMNFFILGKPSQGVNKIFNDSCKKYGIVNLNLWEIFELHYEKIKNSFESNYEKDKLYNINKYFIDGESLQFIETMKVLNEWAKLFQQKHKINDGVSFLKTPYFSQIRKSANKQIKKEGNIFNVSYLNLKKDPQQISNNVHECSDKYDKNLLSKREREILRNFKKIDPNDRKKYIGLTDKEILISIKNNIPPDSFKKKEEKIGKGIFNIFDRKLSFSNMSKKNIR